MISSYKELDVYKKSYTLAIQMHKLSRTYPKHELYELGSQLRRAAISIPLNIAEGYGRKTHLKGFRQYLITALGSCNEVTVILEMSKDLGYLDKESYKKVSEAYDHLGRQLNTMVQKWRRTVRTSNLELRTSRDGRGAFPTGRSLTVRTGGLLGSENAGMSNEKAGENPVRRKPKVS